jgi:hypothetical protein
MPSFLPSPHASTPAFKSGEVCNLRRISAWVFILPINCFNCQSYIELELRFGYLRRVARPMAQQSTTTERNTQLIIENFALPPGQRLQHRRAAKACTACRQRKVRCDVLLRYPRPCTNCEFDGIDCAVPANRWVRPFLATGENF